MDGVIDYNGYMMSRKSLASSISKFNEKVLPLLREMGLDSQDDLNVLWQELNGDKRLVWLIDYAITEHPMPGVAVPLQRKLLEDIFYQHIEKTVPTWKRFRSYGHLDRTYAGKVFEMAVPDLFPQVPEDLLPYTYIKPDGVSYDAKKLQEYYTSYPTAEQMELMNQAEALLAECERMKVYIGNLFNLKGYKPEVNKAFFAKLTPYCI